MLIPVLAVETMHIKYVFCGHIWNNKALSKAYKQREIIKCIKTHLNIVLES